MAVQIIAGVSLFGILPPTPRYEPGEGEGRFLALGLFLLVLSRHCVSSNPRYEYPFADSPPCPRLFKNWLGSRGLGMPVPVRMQFYPVRTPSYSAARNPVTLELVPDFAAARTQLVPSSCPERTLIVRRSYT